MIVVENLSKIYGKKDNAFTALDGVSLKIKSGSTVAIVGKSGSGKSTLMHIMSGLDRPTSGKIFINDTDISAMKSRAIDDFRSQQISFIFQSFFVEPYQTCYQNVILPLEIAKVPHSKRRSMVLKALKDVGLDDKIDVLSANLSGGQKQRLAIARAIVNQPKILFADEPTGNLDTATGDVIIKLLFDLNKKLGCTLITVTHDIELANRCQYQFILKDGKLQNA